MKCLTFNNTNEIKNFDFEYVIQGDCYVGTDYQISTRSITIINPELKYCLYNAGELLNEISNAGKYFMEDLKVNMDFDVKYENYMNNISKNIKRHRIKMKNDNTIDILPLPFGLIENTYYVTYSNEQANQVLDYIVQWCKNYATPCSSIEQSNLIDTKNSSAISLDNTIKWTQIDEFVGKSIIIYTIKNMYDLIFNIQKILYKYEDYIQEDEINKNIKKLNYFSSKIISDWRNMEFVNAEMEYSEVCELLDKLENLIEYICQLTIMWKNRFQNSLYSSIIYDKDEQIYKKVYISNDIANLAWNTLTSIIGSKSPITPKNLCSKCNATLLIDTSKRGRRPLLCDKCKKEKLKSSNRDEERKNMKAQLKVSLENNEIEKEDEDKARKLLTYSNREFLIKEYNKLKYNEKHSK